jgi:hypothetical protein
MTAGPAFSMQRLKNAYRGERAAVIMGGTSLIDQEFDLARLRSKGFVTFLESKALTPRFLASGLTPDYYLMLSADKSLSSAFHNWVFRAFLAGVRIEPFVKREFVPVVRELRQRFDEYFERGNVTRGAHKTYRWRPGVRPANSPYDLLPRLPDTRIIAEQSLLEKYCPGFDGPQERYLYHQQAQPEAFDLNQYYDVVESDGQVTLRNFSFLNSAAIALYPLLRYMGFRAVYFLGMDMSMLGSMEYGAPYTFRSMTHFRWYFWRTRHVFNANYQPNRPWYLRPKSEFEALKSVVAPSKIDLVRVFTPYRYAAAESAMPAIGEREFWLQ